MWRESGNAARNDQSLALRGAWAALVRTAPVHDNGGTIETVVEEFLVGFHREYRRHVARRIRNHPIFRHDRVALDVHEHATALRLIPLIRLAL